MAAEPEPIADGTTRNNQHSITSALRHHRHTRTMEEQDQPPIHLLTEMALSIPLETRNTPRRHPLAAPGLYPPLDELMERAKR